MCVLMLPQSHSISYSHDVPMFPCHSYGHFMVHLNHSPQDVKLWNVVWLPIILGMLPVLPYWNRHMHVIEQNG